MRVLPFAVVALLACQPPGVQEPDSGEPDAGVCPVGTRAGSVSGECVAVGWTLCPEGFAPDPSGWGCHEVLPLESCAPGSYPVLGNLVCQPVGTRSCGAGFEQDPSGWGCRPVLPAQDCSGATMEQLGQQACVPIGDCAAQFPPAGASLFVDDSYGPSQLDSTHFASIVEALAAAAPGATIAVEEGLYLEPLTASKPVKLVGRCAQKVVLEGTGASRGVTVSGVTGVEVSGFTIRGFNLGMVALSGGQGELNDSLVEGNLRFGVGASGAGSKLTVRRSALRGNLPDSSGRNGLGGAAVVGGELIVEASSVTQNTEMGIAAQDPGSKVRVSGTLVRDTRARPSDGKYGMGIFAVGGAQLEVADSAILGGRFAGVVAQGSATVALIRGCSIYAVERGLDTQGALIGTGVVSLSAALSIEGSTIAESHQHGIRIEQATLTIKDSVVRGGKTPAGGIASYGLGLKGASVGTVSGLALVGNEGNGGIVQDSSRLELSESLVAGSKPLVNVPSTGFGLHVRDSASLKAAKVAWLGNATVALNLPGPASSADLEAVVISDTATALLSLEEVPLGLGIDVIEGSSLVLRRSVLRRNAGAAILVDGPGTTANISGTLLADTRMVGPDPSHGYGLYVGAGASATLDGVGLVQNRTSAIHISGAHLAAQNSLARQTDVDGTDSFGYGLEVINGGSADVVGLALVDNPSSGVLVNGAGARASLRGTLVWGKGNVTRAGFGYGVTVMEDARCDLRDSTVVASRVAGLVFAAATGSLAGCRAEDNPVAISLQGGTALREEIAVPDAVSPHEVVVTSDTVFIGNPVRLQGGAMPLPPISSF